MFSLSIILGILGTIVAVVSFIWSVKIHKKNRKLVKETDDLKTLIEARDKFAATAVHDLKNPITTIKLYTQLIGNKNLGRQADKILDKSTETIGKETDKLLSMVDQLLDYSRIQNGKFIIKRNKFNLYKLCKNRIDIIKKSYPKHKFIFYSSDKRIKICADQTAIDRVITNLLVNAVKYSPENKPIKLKLEKGNKFCKITIIDRGKGIKKEEQDLLFEPFYQTDDSSQGLGLGLYIVKSLVELHRGEILMNSKKNIGTAFSINLPLF